MTDPSQPFGELIPIIRDALGSVPADIVGLAGGDWIRHQRIRNWSRLSEKTAEILKSRGRSENPEQVRPSILIPVLEITQTEPSDELLDLWARLLAAAADPSRSQLARNSFVDLLKRFDPTDAIVLQKFWEVQNGAPNSRDYIASVLKISSDSVAVSFSRLGEFGLLANPSGGPSNLPGENPSITALGRELMRALK